MSRVYFTPNPEESSPIGLLEVPVVDVEADHHNQTYAELIRRAIEASQVDDPQARIMEAFYRGGGIHRDVMDQVEPTVLADSVALPLRSRLRDIREADPDNFPFTRQEIRTLVAILKTHARDNISYLTNDGLVVDVLSGGFTTPLLRDEDGTESLELGEAELALVTQLGIEAYAYQTELVWRPGEDGANQPVLLSEREYTLLGRFAADGMFEPVVTLLTGSHPARQ